MAYPELIELPGVRLERWVAVRHRPALEAMRADPDVTRFLEFLLREDLSEMAMRQEDHWEEFGFGLWATVLPQGACGWVGAVHPRWHPEFQDELELAWGFCRPAWGLGIATRGGHAAAAACFDVLGLASVMAFFDPANTRSIAVGTRLGMTPTGETTDREGHPLLTYGLTPDLLRPL